MLSSYYKKTYYNFIKNIDVKDRSISILVFLELRFLEFIFLNIVFREFIRNLIDHEIRKNVNRNIIQINRFLFKIYNLTKETRRNNFEI